MQSRPSALQRPYDDARDNGTARHNSHNFASLFGMTKGQWKIEGQDQGGGGGGKGDGRGGEGREG